MYLYQLQQKYEKKVTDPNFDNHALRNRLAIGFWIYYALYTGYWVGIFMISKAEEDLVWVDFANSFWFVMLIPVYYTLCNNLIKSINKLLGYAEEALNAPGVPQIVMILRLQCTAMLLRAVFVSL